MSSSSIAGCSPAYGWCGRSDELLVGLALALGVLIGAVVLSYYQDRNRRKRGFRRFVKGGLEDWETFLRDGIDPWRDQRKKEK